MATRPVWSKNISLNGGDAGIEAGASMNDSVGRVSIRASTTKTFWRSRSKVTD